MKNEILEHLAKRGNGDIYLGVVGAVRTGKSTFIKKVLENLIIPNIEDEIEKKRYLDEVPQSASGKTIMTTEPKFVPSNGAKLNIDNMSVNVKLVDCVGYMINGASGDKDNNGDPRMVMTPWFTEAIPFTEAAEIGTEKVIRDHSTIGIVITTDGSFTGISRESYTEAEEKVIEELKSIGKPFIVVLNTKNPNTEETKILTNTLIDKYNVSVIPMSIIDMNERELNSILKSALYEYDVVDIEYNIPEWVHVLDNKNDIKAHYLNLIKNSSQNINKLKDVDNLLSYFKEDEYINNAIITNVDAGSGIVSVNLDSSDELYNNVLKDMIGDAINSKAAMIKIFETYVSGKAEYDSIKSALKQARNTGYGIVYPSIKDMKLDKPEIIKQGSRYGVKLKAVASSIHLIKVDVESTFEPIIGSELQSKELINSLMNNNSASDSIWKSEIFGRPIDDIVQEGIKAKLNVVPENTRYKLSQTVSKIVNKGSNNLIAIVL